MARVLLYGGSFNPIHHGHLIVSRAVAEQLRIDRIILIPSAHPPHKQKRELAPAEGRLEMCRLAVAGDSNFEVSDWEIRQPGPNYTLYTVRHFQQVFRGNSGMGEHGDKAGAERPRGQGKSQSFQALGPSVPQTLDSSQLYWLLGMDSLIELPTWYQIAELADACALVTALRPGFPQPDLSHLSSQLSGAQIEKIARHILPSPLIDIRATDIRARTQAGLSIRYLVPEAVREYIVSRQLYQAEEGQLDRGSV